MPPYRAHAGQRAYPYYRTRNRMCRADRNSAKDSQVEGDRRSGLSTEAIDGPKLNDLLARRFYNSPAAEQRPKPHRKVTSENDLGWNLFRRVESSAFLACRNQQKEN